MKINPGIRIILYILGMIMVIIAIPLIIFLYLMGVVNTIINYMEDSLCGTSTQDKRNQISG